ncbi:MAG: metallophosphoesterase [Eubacterium sp.]|nr:metallophosphoesterase [Eubacterium sp.]
MTPFKFYLIADPHYFASKLGAYGKEYDAFMHYEQKCFAETQSINEAVFDWLAAADEADTVFIAGDLVFNGERESHYGFLEQLQKLRDAGKRVYVITADHDFKETREECFAFDDTGKTHPENMTRAELFDLYSDYGFGEAIAVDRQHLSYVAQLTDGLRLLALNNDGASDGGRHFDEEHIAWIKEQTAKAREDGQMMIAMNHYPILPGQPIFSLISSTYQKDGKAVADLLANEGVHLIFTGHMHMHSVNEYTTEKGNKLYDVCTGSIIADPSVIRLVEVIDDATVDIKTIEAPDFVWDTGGRTCKQYLSDMFDQMIVNVLYDMAYDTERMMNKFGLDKKLKPVLKTLGKILQKTTVGGLGRMLFFKTDKSVRKAKVKDVAAELVRVIFEGNQYFKEGTPMGDAILAVFGRMKPIFKKIHAKNFDGSPADIYDLLKNSAGNYGIDDYNAVLKLK